MGGDGGCRVGKVRDGTPSPMPDLKGFKLQQLVNFQKFSTLRVNIRSQDVYVVPAILAGWFKHILFHLHEKGLGRVHMLC